MLLAPLNIPPYVPSLTTYLYTLFKLCHGNCQEVVPFQFKICKSADFPGVRVRPEIRFTASRCIQA